MARKKITKNTEYKIAIIKKLENAITDQKNRSHLWENKDQVLLRKSNEYCKIHGVGNGVKKNKTDQPYFYVKNGEKWEMENIIFRKFFRHKWETSDHDHKRYDRKEICFLFHRDRIVIVNAITEKHEIKFYREGGKIEEEKYTIIRIPKYKMKFEVQKMYNFSDIPEKIWYKGSQIFRDSLFKTILQKSVNIYEVK